MKPALVLAFLFLLNNSYAQDSLNKLPGVVMSPNGKLPRDTSLRVVYADQALVHQYKNVAFYLNGKLVHPSLIGTINPNQIESINVIKDDIRIDSILYYDQIHIKTKNNYSPQIITLSDLKAKYTKLKNKAAIFMIDGSIINTDYDQYMVDENNLLTIVIDKVESIKEGIDLGLIKIFTKTDKNIEERNTIRIRGNSLAARD